VIPTDCSLTLKVGDKVYNLDGYILNFSMSYPLPKDFRTFRRYTDYTPSNEPAELNLTMSVSNSSVNSGKVSVNKIEKVVLNRRICDID